MICAEAKLSLLGAARAVNELPLTAVPPGVVTRMGPVVTPAGAAATICVTEPTLKDPALRPLNVTAVASLNLVPVMVTVVPALPLEGLKPVIVGAGITVKLAALWPVPLAVVTLIGPVVAPPGTVAVIRVGELTVGLAEVTPLKATLVTLTKLAPVITTLLPMAPLVGLNPLITGRVVTVNTPALWAVPAGVLTLIFPVVAPAGTVAVIWMEELTANDVAVVPLKLTLAALVAVPAGVVTLIGPVTAPLGTVATSWVLELTVKLAALSPANFTALALLNLVPATVTLVPGGPLVGTKPVMMGGLLTALGSSTKAPRP